LLDTKQILIVTGKVRGQRNGHDPESDSQMRRERLDVALIPRNEHQVISGARIFLGQCTTQPG
jgi:hypothetical protein